MGLDSNTRAAHKIRVGIIGLRVLKSVFNNTNTTNNNNGLLHIAEKAGLIQLNSIE